MERSRYSRQTKPLTNKKGMFNLKRKRTRKGILQVLNIKKHFKLGTDTTEVLKKNNTRGPNIYFRYLRWLGDSYCSPLRF